LINLNRAVPISIEQFTLVSQLQLIISHYYLVVQMNIYVANIPFKASEQELKGLFEEYGEVSSAKIIMDKVTQRSRGFGFIEMADDSSARQAIDSLNGFSFLGKTLVVNEARPKTDAPRTGGGFNRNGGGFNRRNEY
jgi:RNA recognition motif-containing protein